MPQNSRSRQRTARGYSAPRFSWANAIRNATGKLTAIPTPSIRSLQPTGSPVNCCTSPSDITSLKTQLPM
ncbi:hypothetical protein G6F23_016043 [Rhizopus arrhizus]|nr:hypothetical protein G6F23_016043 [Rhizopus arrhizus]